MPTPTIRHAEASDAPAIVALIDQHVATGALLPRTRDFVADRAADFLVAEVDDAQQAAAVDAELLAAAEKLAARRQYATLFAVTNDLALFERRGWQPSSVPELYPERDEVGRFAGVVAKEL